MATIGSPLPDPERQALRRLVDGAVPQDELASLIESIMLNVKATVIVEFLQGDDAKKFVEVMYGVWVTSSVSE